MLEMALKPELVRQSAKRGIYPVLDEELKPITDKLVRARPLQGRMQAGGVLLPNDQPWVDELVMELLRFPGGLHDDIVDALAWLVRMLGRTVHKPKSKRPPRRPTKSWKDELKKYVKGGSTKDWRAA